MPLPWPTSLPKRLTPLILLLTGLQGTLACAAESDTLSGLPYADCSSDMFRAGNELKCLSDEALGSLRGGFLDNGILIGFGFERVVTIDGEIQEQVAAAFPVLNLSDGIAIVPSNRLLHLDRDNIQLDGSHWSSLGLSTGKLSDLSSYDTGNSQVQIVNSSAALNEMMSNIIQNTVDERTIEQIRNINIEIFGLGAVPDFDPHRELTPALIESLGR